MSEWIAHSKDLFMQSLAEVGQNHQHALDLQTQHQHFTANCMVSLYVCLYLHYLCCGGLYSHSHNTGTCLTCEDKTHLMGTVCVQNGSVNVDSVVTVAARLAEAGHYGADRISLVSSRLQEDWKSLTTTLEERSNTLAMATGFHQGAEQVITFNLSILSYLVVHLTIVCLSHHQALCLLCIFSCPALYQICPPVSLYVCRLYLSPYFSPSPSTTLIQVSLWHFLSPFHTSLSVVPDHLFFYLSVCKTRPSVSTCLFIHLFLPQYLSTCLFIVLPVYLTTTIHVVVELSPVCIYFVHMPVE